MMKKLTKLTKTLLVAAGLCMGQSAWADATVIYGRALTADTDNGYSAWSSGDVATSGTNVWIGNFAYNETYGLYASASGGRSSVMTFTHTDNSLQTFDLVYNNLGNTGDSGNYTYIKIGSDIEIRSNQQDQYGKVIINGTESSISNCNVKNYNRGGDSWNIHVEVNTATKTVTALTITGTPVNGKYASYTLSKSTSLSSSATFNTVTIGFTRVKGTPSAALTSIKIAEEEQTVSTADYTINYIYNSETIKTVTGTDVIGNKVYAESPITIDDVKYYAADGATTSMTITSTAADNVLDVTLRAAETWAYTVNAVDGSSNVLAVIATGTCVEGESVTVGYPFYVNVDGTLYSKSATSDQYRTSITPDADNYVANWTYTSTDITNVVYHSEGENISGATATSNGNNMSVRSSNAKCGYATSDITLITLPAGTYTATMVLYSNSSAGTSLKFNFGGDDVTKSVSTASNWSTLTEEFTLTETTAIKWLTSGDSKNGLDFIYITGTPTNKIIGALDYSTAFMGAYSDVSLAKGKKVTFNFQNHGSNASIWNNWALRMIGTDVAQTLRADNYVLGDGDSQVSTRSWTTDGTYMDENAFKSDMVDATATITVYYYDNGIFTVKAKEVGNTHTYDHWFAYNATKSGDIALELGVDLAWLELTNTPTTADATVDVTIGNSGWATLYTPTAVSFSGSGLKAYTATCDGSTVTLTEVTDVPANTGVVLKGSAGTYNLAEISSSSTGQGSLHGSIAAATFNNANTDRYMLALNNDNEAQFTKLGDGFIAAGKAYLEVTKGGARSLRVVFADETQGIESVSANAGNSDDCYDIQGRRVAQPQKGLYIKNGKKVVMK